jgi:HupE / UreJ protein
MNPLEDALRPWRTLLAALSLLAAMAGASAHQASDAFVQLQLAERTLTERVDIALRDIDQVLWLDADDDGALTWREVRTRWPEIQRLAAEGVRLDTGTASCLPAGDTPPQLVAHSDGTHAVLTRTLQCDMVPDRLAVDYRLFQDVDATHRGIVRWTRGDPQAPVGGGQALLTPGAGTVALFAPADTAAAATPGWAGLPGFIAEGVHHLLIGWDHILFLLALLLPAVYPRGRGGVPAPAPTVGGVVRDVVQVVTAFTVAHSITLSLAATGVLLPPARWVESLIAASVVLAALNNVWPVVTEGRWKIGFGFGLIHGFGFAGALADAGLVGADRFWPLLGFNVGVELGQLLVVALVLPLAWALRGTRVYRGPVLRGGSLAIAALAAVWLAERALDVDALGWI